MKTEGDSKMTDLDYLTASPRLQMIKAALPYIHVPEQRFLSLMVKFSELERTMNLFQEKEDGMVGICSLEEDTPSSPLDMLNAMKPYGTQQEQEFIDLVINFLQGSRLYQSYQESASQASPSPADSENGQNGGANQSPRFSIDHLKNLLPPEQQSKLETAQLLMQTIQGFS